MRIRRPLQVVLILLASLLAVVLNCITLATPAFSQGDYLTESCLACHSSPGRTMTLPSGEVIDLYVDRERYEKSVHGQVGLSCNHCHRAVAEYPHPELEVSTRRELAIDLYPVCTTCHEQQIMDIQGNVHMVALTTGNPEAAVCSDCHGMHYVQPAGEPRSAIPQTCRKCHSELYDLYESSVHGSALIGQGNADVPSCTDCHGSHELLGPSNSPFHLFSPEICAKCHNDQGLMGRYGIRADVYDTYVADFHGTTVSLFQAVAPDQGTNKPVCVDCHGVHDILPPDDPDSTVMKENLLETCRRCHPDATTNFPDSWLSHYNPGPRRWPLVFFVTWFYRLLIPTVIGGMLIFVIIDRARQVIDARRGRLNG